MAVQLMDTLRTFPKKGVNRYLSNRLYLTVKRFSSNFNDAQSQDQTWDIVISGGGMVGSAMACSLGKADVLAEKKILLLESSKTSQYSVDPEKYSNRVSAISPASKSLFERLGIWKRIARSKEVKKMQVWESCSDARIVFQHLGMVNDIAHIIENNAILQALTECLQDLEARVEVRRGAVATEYSLPKRHGSENVTIKLADGQSLQTKLLIGADGVNSKVRQTMGVKYVNWDYNQKGIVATLKLGEATANVVAWQRFLPSGPIALLPLTDELCSLVWTVSLPLAEKLRSFSDEEFVDALNSCLWGDKNKNPLAEVAVSRFKDILFTICPGKESVHQLPPSVLSVEPNSRAEFPLGLGHSTQYVATRVALIGDAAHRVHPLAGQGVNLGFGDVECLTECLETSVYNGNDIGCIEPLLEYETQRQRSVVPTMAAIDTLNRLYKTEFTPIVLLRSLGLTLVDSLSFVKISIIINFLESTDIEDAHTLLSLTMYKNASVTFWLQKDVKGIQVVVKQGDSIIPKLTRALGCLLIVAYSENSPTLHT